MSLIFFMSKVICAATCSEFFGIENASTAVGLVITAVGAAGVVGISTSNALTRVPSSESGAAARHDFDPFFFLMAALLAAGVLCASLMRPIRAKIAPLETALVGGTSDEDEEAVLEPLVAVQ